MDLDRRARVGLAIMLGLAVSAFVACIGCNTGAHGGGAGEPVLTVQVDPTTGVAPLDAVLTATPALSDGSPWFPTRMGVDWGAYNSQETVNGIRTTFTYRYTLSGVYTVSCWAIDDRTGDQAQTTTVVQVSGASNTPPTCTLTADPTSGDAPLLARFTGTGADPDGTIVEWSLDYDDGAQGWVGTTAPEGRGHIYTAAGVYRPTLTVQDNLGAHALFRDTVTVTESTPPLP